MHKRNSRSIRRHVLAAATLMAFSGIASAATFHAMENAFDGQYIVVFKDQLAASDVGDTDTDFVAIFDGAHD